MLVKQSILRNHLNNLIERLHLNELQLSSQISNIFKVKGLLNSSVSISSAMNWRFELDVGLVYFHFALCFYLGDFPF